MSKNELGNEAGLLLRLQVAPASSERLVMGHCDANRRTTPVAVATDVGAARFYNRGWGAFCVFCQTVFHIRQVIRGD
jgi:hypothetical protein